MRVKKLTSHLWGKKPNDEDDDDHPSILPFLNQLSKRKKSRNKRKRTFFKVGKEGTLKQKERETKQQTIRRTKVRKEVRES
jgi:hypothetical protein